jgi:hypothetical protein
MTTDPPILVRCIGCHVPLGQEPANVGMIEHARTCSMHPLAIELAQLRKRVEDLVGIISASAPLTWVASSNMAAAGEWERVAYQLIKEQS